MCGIGQTLDWARGEFGDQLALHGRTEEAIRVLEEVSHTDPTAHLFLGSLLQKEEVIELDRHSDAATLDGRPCEPGACVYNFKSF
jgi:hypothetical protein